MDLLCTQKVVGEAAVVGGCSPRSPSFVVVIVVVLVAVACLKVVFKSSFGIPSSGKRELGIPQRATHSVETHGVRTC